MTERFIQIAMRAYEKKNFAAVFALIFGGIIDLEKSLPHTWDVSIELKIDKSLFDIN